MASKQLIKLTTILFLIVFPLLSSAAMQIPDDDEVDDNEEDVYILDSNFSNSRLTSKFLGNAIKKIKKGVRCDAKSYNNICNGISANNGTSILHCCKKHCRNVFGDRNNCSQCGHKCRLDQRCCGGVCTNVVDNKSHCGKCFKKCSQGVRCEYGYCGYA